jgi:hypothetical protein
MLRSWLEVGVHIPIEANFVSEDLYQLLPDDDANLFEFGSQDTVSAKQLIENEKQLPAACELVKAGDAGICKKDC